MTSYTEYSFFGGILICSYGLLACFKSITYLFVSPWYKAFHRELVDIDLKKYIDKAGKSGVLALGMVLMTDVERISSRFSVLLSSRM